MHIIPSLMHSFVHSFAQEEFIELLRCALLTLCKGLGEVQCAKHK